MIQVIIVPQAGMSIYLIRIRAGIFLNIIILFCLLGVSRLFTRATLITLRKALIPGIQGWVSGWRPSMRMGADLHIWFGEWVAVVFMPVQHDHRHAVPRGDLVLRETDNFLRFLMILCQFSLFTVFPLLYGCQVFRK